jgi:glycine cleavage system H lipoate-binding protein
MFKLYISKNWSYDVSKAVGTQIGGGHSDGYIRSVRSVRSVQSPISGGLA